MGGVATRPGRGRKPKPTKQKALAGNPGKRKLNSAEPDFGLMAGADAPEWMPDLARSMWETVVPLLCGQNVLAPTDLHNVEAFCLAYSRWRIAETDIAENGITGVSPMGARVKNPAVTVANEALRQMTSFGALLGLDPSSRSRLMGKKPSGGANPFGDLVNP